MVTSMIDVAGRVIGPEYPCFIIAEAGVNHCGNVRIAHELIDAAATAGADAVKFQTFVADKLVTREAPTADYQREAIGPNASQYEMLRQLELTYDAHVELAKHAGQRGILFLSTPFHEEAGDLLEELGVPAFKLASGEITNLPFLAHMARKGRPLILSTGMSSLGDVERAIRTVESNGNPEIVLLHCVSNYPADPADVNLRAMATLEHAFGRPVGYSDHTINNAVAFAAVALGACVVEKHFTLDRNLGGPDHAASLEPGELALLVQGIRTVEAALGSGRKQPRAAEAATAAVARKSLVAARPISAGTVVSDEMIATKRPGNGLSPALRASLVGRRALVDIASNQMLRLEFFE